MSCDRIGELFSEALKQEAKEFEAQVEMDSFWESFEHKVVRRQELKKSSMKRDSRIIKQVILGICCGFVLFGAGVAFSFLWRVGSFDDSYSEGSQYLHSVESEYSYLEAPPVPLSSQIPTYGEFVRDALFAPGLVILGIAAGIIFYHVFVHVRRKYRARRVIMKVIKSIQEETL